MTLVLSALSEAGVVLIGGQAVNIWSEIHEVPDEDPWRTGRPYTSVDADGLAETEQMVEVVRLLKSQGFDVEVSLPCSRQEQSVNTGMLTVSRTGLEVAVNLLHRIIGINPQEIRESALVTPWNSIHIRLLHPLLCVESKAYNLNTLEQDRSGERRQDRKHLLLSLGNLRQHLLARSTTTHETSCLRMARRLVDLAYHQMGLDTLTCHEVDILTGIPWVAWREGKLTSLQELATKESEFRQEIQNRLRAVEDLDAWVQKLRESEKHARKKKK